MDQYQAKGFTNRVAYLESLASELGLPMVTVVHAADLFGPEEDFDGLVCHLEDIAYDPYPAFGFKDRLTYLESLARDFNLPLLTVKRAAVLLGPDEDFDGLVSHLEDIAYACDADPDPEY